MKKIIAALGLVTPLAAAVWGQPAPPQPEQQLFQEIGGILTELGQITGLKPLKPVKHDLIGREQVKQFLEDRIKEEVNTQWVKKRSGRFSYRSIDGGLILVRELDERLGFGNLIDQRVADPRQGKNTQFPLADLLRQSVYSRLASYEDVKDAERLSQDPAFRLIGSEKIWERGAASGKQAGRREEGDGEVHEKRLDVQSMVASRPL
jgi:hypothetical protein